jgi:plastocyanin
MLSMRTLAALTAAATALALGACGDDEETADSGSAATATPAATDTPAPDATEDSGGGGGEDIALAADPGGALKFDKTELTAKAGKVTISFDNQSSVPHAVEVEGNGVEEETKTITKSSNKLELDLKAGSYEFYCPVGNHRAAGMEGKLTVE